MKTYTSEELKRILEEHRKWVLGEGGSRADLSGANLIGADLSRADLSRAALSRANLIGANLSGADLSRAYLIGAYLIGAYLSRADLSGAYLSGADLSGAITDDKTKLLPFLIVPETGDFEVWKKLQNDFIAHLLIPRKAKRVSCPTGRKCRAEYAKTLHIWDAKGKSVKSGISKGMGGGQPLTYKVGEITRPDSYDPDWRIECSHGIHFFITRREAEEF